ncbi:MAG TPA: malto-oligosyltrehalose synthase [Thermoleophilaceae bacterium]
MSELRATYRLQLSGDFGFAAARSLVPYLASLGVSHIYLPPSFEARPGSTHGYDVVDPGRISSALGGEEEFRALADEARAAGLGIVLDLVPNHMAADEANRYWADDSLRSKFFDIDPATGRHRRFFDIDHLAGVRQEDPEVFEETHRLALSLVREGVVDGLRVDHPDGLANPAEYLSRLDARRVWVEKILDPGERLRDWPVSGTVGYEFLNDVAALFVDPAGEAPLTSLWHEVAGDTRPFGAWAYEAKLEQASSVFALDVERLGRELGDGADVEALTRAVSSLPVYRTYVDPSSGAVDEQDREAIRAARMEPWIERLLLLEDPGPAGFVTRFQQTTPAVMAKGVEDTAFYRYARLLTLNEVGGDPSRFGVSAERFHQGNLERAERFPLNLLTTQTHDAKRSGDVRARIGVLASMPDEWREHVERWLALGGVPDPVEAYVVFQTLVGAWPIEVERVEAYMEKALREAKRTSSWIEPNVEHEEAVKAFVRGLYSDRRFLDDFEPFVERVAAAGERAALGQLALKLTAPGVPDIYQGDELAYRALVDPDNRRPVDFERRRSLLASINHDRTPRKLWLTWRLLQLRGENPEPFAGSYEPYDAGENVCAYVRGGEVLVAVSVREGAVLPKAVGAWRDLVRLDEYGVAVLVR